ADAISLSLSLSLSLSNAVGLTALACFALAGGLSSQIPGSGDQRVLHLWVVPYFGDDALAGGAAALNPNGASSFAWCTPVVPPRPHQVFNSAGDVLLHAPHPFKTITAAVDYIVATNPGGSTPLPALGGVDGVDWQHAIIHLMPGLYK